MLRDNIYNTEQYRENISKMSYANLTTSAMIMLDSLPVAILIVDKTGFIHYHNQAADNIFETYFITSEKKHIVTDELNKNDFKQLIKQLEQASAKPPISLSLSCPQSYKQIDLSISLHPEQKGFYLITVNSINNQQQLKKNFKELKQVSRLSAMREISSSLADKLNQPLTVILSYTQAMQRLYKCKASSVEIEQAMERVVINAESAGQIIKDIRAKLKANHLNYHDTNIKQLIQETINLTALEDPASSIKLNTHYETACVSLCIDAVQIKQVILNLLNNAIDVLTEKKIHTPEITLNTKKQNSCYEISITDNGSGFPDEVQAHLFEAFNSTRKNGIGIGLSISQHIIDLHHGSIKINSSKNNKLQTQRTTATITLPLRNTPCSDKL